MLNVLIKSIDPYQDSNLREGEKRERAPILSPTDQARAATGTSLSHWEVEMVICSPLHRRDCQSQRQGVTRDGTEQDENRALGLQISFSLQSFLFPSSPSTQHRGGCTAMGFKSWTT